MTRPSRTFILAACCGLFFALGLISAVVGPLLAELARNAGVNLETIGSLFTGIFVGALLSQLAAGPLGDRAGYTWIVLGGTLVMAAGALGFSFSQALAVTLVFGFLYGVGHGAVDLGTSLLVAGEFKGSSVSALNMLNLFFGLGAFAGPALVSLALGAWGTGLPVVWACCLVFFAFTPLILRFRTAGRRMDQPGGEQPAAARTAGSPGVYRSPVVWVFGALILVYVGLEVGMGGWTTIYVERSAGLPIETASLVTSGFWLALTSGRMVTALVGRRLNPDHLLTGSLVGAAAGGLLLALSTGSLALTIAAVLLIGFCFGPVFPTVIASITARFPANPGRAASVVASMGAAGGAILPGLQGVLLERAGLPGSAWFTAGGALVTVALMLWLLAGRKARRPCPPRRNRSRTIIP